MTASEISRLLHGKRTGHGRYMAKCPAHSDSNPSLSIRQGRKAVLLKCWPGCSVRDIVSAMGLKMRDLWYDSDTVPAEVKLRIRDEDQVDYLERTIGLLALAQVMLPEKSLYIEQEKILQSERKELIFKLFPERKAAYDLQVKIRHLGWDGMWAEYFRDNPRVDRSNPIIYPAQTTMF